MKYFILVYTVFGRIEISKRERGEREVGERWVTSLVWLEERVSIEIQIMWDPFW